MNKHFTVHCDSHVDKKIEDDLSLIRNELISQVDNCEALVLVGGFSKGEGSVLVEDGRVEPVNDYDIVIVNGTSFDREKRRTLEQMLSRKVGIRYVDLIPRAYKDLGRLPPTMFNYDMKYGGHVFYGDHSILDIIPGWNEKEIPLVEGRVLLLNRLLCLLECFSMDFLSRCPNTDELFFLKFQSAKTILGCCDALLLLKGLYHQSYMERRKRFSTEFSEHPEWVKLVIDATEFKLKPDRNNNFDAVSCWFRTRSFFMDAFLTFASYLYKRDFSTWNSLYDFYGRNKRTLLKRAAYLTVKRSRDFEKRLNLELSEMALLGAIDRNGTDDLILEKTCMYLSRATGKKYGRLSWEEIRKACVSAWYEINHGTVT